MFQLLTLFLQRGQGGLQRLAAGPEGVVSGPESEGPATTQAVRLAGGAALHALLPAVRRGLRLASAAAAVQTWVAATLKHWFSQCGCCGQLPRGGRGWHGEEAMPKSGRRSPGAGKSDAEGKSVDLGGRRSMKKKTGCCGQE